MPHSQNNHGENEAFPRFLQKSQKIVNDALFIISSLPNAEKSTAERYLHQLQAIKRVIQSTSEDCLTTEEIQDCIDLVNSLLPQLEAFCQAPTPMPSPPSPLHSQGARGRPRYNLDLDRAIELYALGNSWDDVAEAIGVCRKTIYNQLDRAGCLEETWQSRYTDIANNDLDELVASILRRHPMTGAVIMQGHLATEGISVQVWRVGESLKRVDEIGSILRSVYLKSSLCQW